ncbi:hypothetical protein A1O7_09018 [Cladophialophora yegresii CBS 114405]|uniref:Alpha/beta hydrolase fold-3 domain-containing protein n=1 Tax=Cladophialophora yegresii CBS 114405 TaxID=1182544 RepID=W9VK70_9EURO|nr:uncharacterized protein A1O7_09018 [Cladophialophora yegresii CBS 114405]EXJ56087.1 hypothetical protein A1O7_09018 [Cladophialophora yegresii CBS 114405]
MVQLQPSGPEWQGSPPKHGHLSEIDPEFAQLKDEADKNFAILWSLPLDQFKAAWLSAPVPFPENAPQPGQDYQVLEQLVPVRDGTNVGLKVYRPSKCQSKTTLVLKAHGGGWVVGSHETEEVENRFLAAKGNAVVVSVDYRMAPEYKYPYAIDDCFDILQWCKSNAEALSIDPQRIIVAGGSAGGNIAILAQKARDEKVSGIVGQILNIPVTCHPKLFPSDRYPVGSYQQNKDASVIDAPKMLWFWDQYLPNAEPEVYASPLLAKDFSGLPPALIQVAGMDPLRDEGLAYAEALKAAGVPVTLHTFKGLPHGFYFFPQLKQSLEYWMNCVDFVQKLSGKPAAAS